MTQYGRVVALVLLVSSISACSREGRTEQERIAVQLREAAIRCLGDVRDRDEKYEKSQNCRSLTRLAQQYIEAGGFKDSAPPQADRMAESARGTAWSALVMSRTGDKGLSIW